jgi:protein-L-isoaspartate(D-aspartate) O-methyltransferase
MSGYQNPAGVAAAAPGTMPANGPERLARLVRGKGIRDQRLLEAIAYLPRAGFVPPAYSERAYRDEPIPIGHDQVTTQPSLVAAMLEALTLEGKGRVLEVGTGYGFQTGLIAMLARRAFSIERFPDLAEAARRNLARHGIRNVEVVVGDGTAGFPERAPFDAIVVSAAFTSVPEPLVAQLLDGGQLVQPMGPGGRDEVTLFEKRGGVIERRAMITPARFVRLYGDHGFTLEW